MIFFGSATPISKLVGEEFPILSASLFRVLLATLVLLPFVLKDFKKNFKKMSQRDWLTVAGIALFGMVGFTVLLIYGMKFVSGVAGSLVMSLTPAVTAIGAYFFMNSPLGKKRLMAVALGVAGVVVVNVFKGKFAMGDSENFLYGIAMVFLAICCEASYTLLGKRVMKDIDPVFASFLGCALSLPLFVGIAWIDFEYDKFIQAPLDRWLALSWWGIATLGAGSVLWYRGVSKAEGTTAAGMMSVMPISALLLSYFLLGERFYLTHLLGIGLVLSSVGLMSWIHYKEAKKN
ncbi:MAG: hypothetical protein CME64_07770 [Halobacteriovoraceae bacterium]|nr:hypothetical protein [Halobacteriovoraceae bacterium]|tara:strand:+ start:606 stop:1475 length:870 start_codon:yes stop_codon:yes gene_type:complete